MLPVEQPFKTYTGLDGKPLDNGYVYFGQPNQNPITAPVTVFWDAAGMIPAAQPLRTVNGYIMRGGTPANVFFDGAYSETVLDSKKRQVFYARTSDEFSLATTISTFLTDIAGGTGAGLMGFLQAGFGAVMRTVLDKLREFRSIGDFGGRGDGSDDAAALQRAINAVAVTGGTLTIGPGTWNIGAPIVAVITSPVRILLDAGAVLNKTADGDLFAVTLAGAGTFTLAGDGTLTAGWAGMSTSAAAVRVVNNSANSRALSIHGDIKIRKGAAGCWKYGLHLTDVQDPDLSGLLIAGDGKVTQNMVGIYITAVNAASVSWTISDIDIYDCVCGIEVTSARAPGIEGLKLVNVDMVGVKNGLLYTNTSGYSPPQIELSSCHVNSYDTCIKITKAIQVSIIGGLFYRYGSSVGAFFEIDGVQDFSIAGGSKLSIVDPAVDVPAAIFTSTSQLCAFLRLNHLHYWANGRTSPVFRFVGNFLNVAIGGDCTKDTNGPWLDHAGITSAKTEIRLSPNIQINAADYPDTVMTECPCVGGIAGVVDVGAAFWGNVHIKPVSSGDVVINITNSVIGRTYRLYTDVDNTNIQHNGFINLRGGADAVLMAGDSIDLYREVSVLREHARRPT